jgi:polyisoprenoid-binding protein YceI
MRVFNLCLVASLLLCVKVFPCQFSPANRASLTTASRAQSLAIHEKTGSPEISSDAAAIQKYVLDSGRSRFVARAFSGGLLWFKGHDHLIAVREFTGKAQITPDSVNPASLQLNAKAASMVETRDVFTEPQKQIINKELRDIVLRPEQYPDIVFKSTNVSGKAIGSNRYELKIAGDLTLHGVTRPITIPTRVTLTGNELRAQGEFSINRSDFKVKATSALHGMIRVRDRVKFEFDIVGRQR